MRSLSRWSASLLFMVSAIVGAGSATASTSVTPIDGPPPLGPLSGNGAVVPTIDLARLGYELSEFFVEGDADSYHDVEPLTNDAGWVVAPDGVPQPFKTRIQVIKPVSPHKCNGTVYVEWFNVSSQSDFAPDWYLTYTEVKRQGAVFVGVSAQQVGVFTLQALFPDRYGSLSHPGDSYSYDVFSQVGEALIDHADSLFGPGCTPKRLIATGHSQSGSRLVTYVNAVGDTSPYDGFIPRGTAANPSAPLRQPPLERIDPPMPTLVTNLDKPVLRWQSQSESLVARQDDTANLRWWEVAGTAHQDAYVLSEDHGDSAEGAIRMFDFMVDPVTSPGGGFACEFGINAGPSAWVLHATWRHMNRWVKHGAPPPIAPRLATDDGTPTGELVLDENGNAIGGIRSPHVDVPIATLTGRGNVPAPGLPPGIPNFCGVFGTTVPLSEETLDELYPNHFFFTLKWARSLSKGVRDGYFTPEDAWFVLVSAAVSDIGK